MISVLLPCFDSNIYNIPKLVCLQKTGRHNTGCGWNVYLFQGTSSMVTSQMTLQYFKEFTVFMLFNRSGKKTHVLSFTCIYMICNEQTLNCVRAAWLLPGFVLFNFCSLQVKCR